MSGTFDPKKVERWEDSEGDMRYLSGPWVLASDFDAVLAMYQEAMKEKKERDALLDLYRADEVVAAFSADCAEYRRKVEACGWCTIARNKAD